MGVFKKNNRWYIDYYAPDGRRKREVVTITGVNPEHITREDAKDALSIRKAEIAQGKFDINRTKKQIRFDSLMKKYLEWASEYHEAPERDIAASKPLLSFFSGWYINKVNLWLVNQYVSKRRAGGLKPETINKELGILRRMFNLAVEWTLLSTSPVKGLKLLRVSKFNPRVLKDSEFQRIYNVASGHFKPIILCAYLTGMRRGEIAGLKWENIDFEDCYIHLTKTKNNEPRSIPVSRPLFEALERLREASKNDYVFTTPEGKPYTSLTAWKRAWHTALKKAGIEKCRFHDLRHTFVSNLIVKEKEDFATVMDLSGHKDIRMLKRYSHTREEAKKLAINKLGNHLMTSEAQKLIKHEDDFKLKIGKV